MDRDWYNIGDVVWGKKKEKGNERTKKKSESTVQAYDINCYKRKQWKWQYILTLISSVS